MTSNEDRWNSLNAQNFLGHAEVAVNLRRAIRELDDVVLRGSYNAPHTKIMVSKELAGVGRKFLVLKLEDALRDAKHWAGEMEL